MNETCIVEIKYGYNITIHRDLNIFMIFDNLNNKKNKDTCKMHLYIIIGPKLNRVLRKEIYQKIITTHKKTFKVLYVVYRDNYDF